MDEGEGSEVAEIEEEEGGAVVTATRSSGGTNICSTHIHT